MLIWNVWQAVSAPVRVRRAEAAEPVPVNPRAVITLIPRAATPRRAAGADQRYLSQAGSSTSRLEVFSSRSEPAATASSLRFLKHLRGLDLSVV